MRPNIALATILAIGLIMTGAPAYAQLTESPITPGFWSWPQDKLTTPQEIANTCRDKFAVQFSDGRYFGVQLRSEGKALPAPVIDEVGSCKFNRETQVERCELRVNNQDGTVTLGLIESRFSIEPDNTLKMSVTSTVTNVPEPTTTSFDVFPVRCPDEAVWDVLNGIEPPR